MAWRLLRACRPLVTASAAIALHACQSVPGATDQALTQGLQVAEAAVAADRPDLARQLYQSLVERYPDAPAPRLRLARIAFELGDFPFAHRQFVAAAGMRLPERSRAEAWFSAGRAALSLEAVADATSHFRRARALVEDSVGAAWIVNGLAVAATIEADLESAAAYYREAMTLDPSNARIVANYVQMLIEAGQVAEAARIYTGRASSFWSGNDERRLRILLQTHLPD